MRKPIVKVKRNRVSGFLSRFLSFFALFGFVVTCNFFLFFHYINYLPVKPEEVKAAAPVTLFNVILLTALFSIVEEFRYVRRVEKPVRQIQEGIDKIIAGDFSVRIPNIKGENSSNEFDAIINGLNEMTKELSSVETLRTDFVSNVSHELKTPLTVIQNYGIMLQSPNLADENRKEYAKAITEQTKRLSELISNILKLNRLENQQIYPEKRRYNLIEQICECLLLFEQAWEKKELVIETDFDEDVTIYQDGELLSLVWTNLFSNAVKFSNEKGRIFVGVKKEQGEILVEVTDEGCGISCETGNHIFEKFYQGDTSRATQGNGLGLALVKRVIDIVGGDISVRSTLGKGSTFSVRLREETE